MSEKLVNLIAEVDEEQALSLTKELLASGTDPMEILNDCRAAMEIVGNALKKANTSFLS